MIKPLRNLDIAEQNLAEVGLTPHWNHRFYALPTHEDLRVAAIQTARQLQATCNWPLDYGYRLTFDRACAMLTTWMTEARASASLTSSRRRRSADQWANDVTALRREVAAVLDALRFLHHETSPDRIA